MKFTNPANGHTEQVLGTFHWLWCFLWTPIYYAVKGIWTHAIVSLLIGWRHWVGDTVYAGVYRVADICIFE